MNSDVSEMFLGPCQQGISCIDSNYSWLSWFWCREDICQLSNFLIWTWFGKERRELCLFHYRKEWNISLPKWMDKWRKQQSWLTHISKSLGKAKVLHDHSKARSLDRRSVVVCWVLVQHKIIHYHQPLVQGVGEESIWMWCSDLLASGRWSARWFLSWLVEELCIKTNGTLVLFHQPLVSLLQADYGLLLSRIIFCPHPALQFGQQYCDRWNFL